MGSSDALSVFAHLLPAVLPDLQKTPARDRKIVAVGLSRLLTQSQRMLAPPYAQQWAPTLQALIKLFILPQEISKTSGAVQIEDDEEVATADLEATGYQASFSKLGAAEPNVKAASAAIEAKIGDARPLLANQLGALCEARPGVIPPLLGNVPEQLMTPFSEYLASQRVTIK